MYDLGWSFVRLDCIPWLDWRIPRAPTACRLFCLTTPNPPFLDPVRRCRTFGRSRTSSRIIAGSMTGVLVLTFCLACWAILGPAAGGGDSSGPPLCSRTSPHGVGPHLSRSFLEIMKQFKAQRYVRARHGHYSVAGRLAWWSVARRASRTWTGAARMVEKQPCAPPPSVT